ncbi:MAG: phospho-N-acetylmuramoyl-pentapeptide-transferase [Pyrinomonadaceae bacterium]|nr:phospho-N-acetylmuramoyl-pentapeptide-transferase [Pyrinomonadaceae bacterium]MCX7639775.1 phospho-N-acetylmuramoyl-pentapeptide-transferase [Pyrinomonadaceae bacterium]MDW8304358.1 phospho-N-acetylmuramoyl-pentapeptide-transferase [Acidobacteriota bacterium]
MLYYILYRLIYQEQCATGCESYFLKALNVVQYVTFRTAMVTATSLLVTLIFGSFVIRKLAELKFGQEIREEGPQSHQRKKGTPTMGGVLIIGSVFVATLLWARLDSLYLWIALIATTLFAFIGFLDDYIKIVKRRSLGLTGRQKLLGQLLVAIGVWLVLWLWGNYPWNLSIPFFKATAEPFGITYIGPWIYLAFIVFVLLGSSNAVNLTDGLDGLAASMTFIAMSALTALTYVSSDRRWADYLDITHRPEAAELTIFCGAMVGASLGFLWYNAPKAEVFMGDVGSLSIGGAIGTVAVLTKQEFLLPFIGGVFIIEALSVMLQVSVFKLTKDPKTGVGKRIFRMTPLHHHFEMKGWEEPKIVFRFVIIGILFALLSLSTLKLR